MPKTREEKNAFLNGINRERRRRGDVIAKVINLAKSWREKAREGMGGARCDKCRFWVRGGPGCRWGYCHQDHSSAPELGMLWAETEDRTGARLVSHENFACINFARMGQ